MTARTPFVAAHVPGGLLASLGSAATRLGVWLTRHRQRRQLAELDDAMLKDIGLSRADVYGEVTKPFWRP
jgi:uncharacterized protein YjiS (DUF1127 family)